MGSEEQDRAELAALEQEAAALAVEDPGVAEDPEPTFLGDGCDVEVAARHARRTLAGAWGVVALVLDEYGDVTFAEAVDGSPSQALELARRTADLQLEDGLRPFAVRCTADSAQVLSIVRF